jgi:hypothetical protein
MECDGESDSGGQIGGHREAECDADRHGVIEGETGQERETTQLDTS